MGDFDNKRGISRSKGLELVAIILICLVLSLPFNISIAYASISSVTIQGRDEINGVIASDDYLDIEAVIDGYAIANDIGVDFPDNSRFDECNYNEDLDKATCHYQQTIGQQLASKIIVGVHQYSEANELIDSKDNILLIDGLAPQINDISIRKQGNNISMDYDITDSACEECGDGCAGVGGVNIVFGQNILRTLNIREESCRTKGTFMGGPEYFGLSDESMKVCFVAFDNVGNPSVPYCPNITVDLDPPSVDVGSFKLTDQYYNEINFLSGLKQIDAIISVNISDSELDMNSVYGDFSEFNYMDPAAYSNVKADCELIKEGNYTCTWKKIKIISDEKKIDYTITAKDTFQNVMDHDGTITLKKDETPPKLLKMYVNPKVDYESTYSYDDSEILGADDSEKLYFKNGKNRLYIDFENDGSGYYGKQVFIDYTILGIKQTKLQAKDCYIHDNVWTCYWELDASRINDDDEFTVLLRSETMDDANNKITKPLTFKGQIDLLVPIVNSVTIDNKCPSANEKLRITLDINDESPLYVYTHPNTITTSNKTYVAKCQRKEGTRQVCVFEIKDFTNYHSQETVMFYVEDSADLEAKELQVIEVCEGMDGAPDLVTVYYDSESQIDRRTLGFVAVPAFVSIVLKPREGAEIIDKRINCNGVDEAYLLNQDSNNPTLVLRLSVGGAGSEQYEDGTISINCNLDMKVKQGRQVFKGFESEQLNITFKNHDALGVIDQAMQEKIDDVQQDIYDIDAQIADLEAWNAWFSMLCTMAEMMAMMDIIMSMVKVVFFGIAAAITSGCETVSSLCSAACEAEGVYWACFDSCMATGAASAYCTGTACSTPLSTATTTFITCESKLGICEAGWALWYPICYVTTSYNEFIDSFVWPAGWDFCSFGTYIKTLCMLYSCKICTLNPGSAIARSVGVDSGFVKLGLSATALTMSGPAMWVALGGGVLSGAGDIWAGNDEKAPSHLNIIFEGMDPYKSIHAARSCLCLPAIIYNLKKDRQIKCMYKTCLERNAETGLPSDICDEAYKERECLYVDGAAWKVFGSSSVMSFFENLFGFLLRNLPTLIAGTYWRMTCKDQPMWLASCGQTATKTSERIKEVCSCNKIMFPGSDLTGSCLQPGICPTVIGTAECPGVHAGVPAVHSCVSVWNSPAFKDTMCQITGSGIVLSEIGEFSIFSGDVFGKYSGDLKGDVVC